MGKSSLKASSSTASQPTTNLNTSTVVPTEETQQTTTAAQDTSNDNLQTSQTSGGEDTNSDTFATGTAVGNDSSVAAAEVNTTEEKPLVATADQLVAPVAQVAEAVVVDAPIVVEKAVPISESAATTDALEIILKSVPGSQQTDINRILMYIGRMKPGRPIDTKMGVNEQVALYRSIQNIINRQEEYFTQLFTALLYLFQAEGNGALGDRYRMRFMDSVTLHAGDRKGFQYLTQMLHMLADPQSREIMMTQINMELALQNGLTPDGRTRVLNYFNV
jgi:hypothetical protein